MATKTLYDVLEVAPAASPEIIATAYQAKCARIKAQAASDPDAAAMLRAALDEAYKTLSNPDLRKRYDGKLAVREKSAVPSLLIEEEPSWFSRNAVSLIVVGALLGGGYLYYRHVQAEKAAAEKLLREKEERLAKEQAEREAMERQQAEAEAEKKRKIEEVKYLIWVDQTRRAQSYYSRQEEARQAAIKRDAERQQRDAERQQRMEEMQKQREEAQARARLEQEKRRLQSLENQNTYGGRY
jgi:hypothetical protein